MTRRGFTKVELLIVIGMIAVLAAILFPVFAKSRETARRGTCLNNLWQIGQALRLYALDGDGRYPPTEDDLSPLYPRYLDSHWSFLCPSNASGTVLMGAPANPKLWAEAPGPGGASPPDDRLRTAYYYRAGRLHNQTPRAPLCSDQYCVHNDRANLLYSDGSLKSLPETPWRAQGFVPLAEIQQRRAAPSGRPGPAGPGGGEE